MWKILQKSPVFFIKCCLEADVISISVTNFIKIWNIKLNKKTLLDILKESNEDMVFDDESILLEKGVDMLLHPEQLKNVTINEKEEELSVLLTKSYGYVLWLNLDLILSGKQKMFAEVIQPLLKTVNDLRESQVELRQELIKKDKEIEEYKCEGGQIALRHLKTVPYDDSAHMAKHKCFDEHFENCFVEELLKPKIAEDIRSDPTQPHKETKPQIKTELCNRSTKAKNPSNEHQLNRETIIKNEPSSHNQDESRNDITPKIEDSPRKRHRNKLNF